MKKKKTGHGKLLRLVIKFPGPLSIFLTPNLRRCARTAGEEKVRVYFEQLSENSIGEVRVKQETRHNSYGDMECAVPRASSRGHSLALPVSKKPNWRPPVGSWEDKIHTIDGCEDADNGDRIVYVTWKGGERTKHKAQAMHVKCPQKVRFLPAYQTSSSLTHPATSVLRAFCGIFMLTKRTDGVQAALNLSGHLRACT